MKTIFGILLFVCSVNLSALDASFLKSLEKDFPGITSQLENLEKATPSLVNREILQQLIAYGLKGGQECRLGLNSILQQEAFDQAQFLGKKKIIIDGDDRDWKDVPLIVTDAEGDGTKGTMDGDILEQRAFLDEDLNLYMMMRPKNPISEELIYQPLITFDDDKDWSLQVLTASEWSQVNLLIKGKKVDQKVPSFEVKTGRVYEFKLPMKGFFKNRGGFSSLKIWSGYFHKEKYDDVSQTLFVPQNNSGLELLLSLFKNNPYQAPTPLFCALAKANEILFQMADIPTKALIKLDLQAHLDLYGSILKWQKDQKLAYTLDRLPYSVLCQWAARYNKNYQLDLVREAMAFRQVSKMTSEIYLEFIDQITLLKRIFQEIVKKDLPIRQRLEAMAQGLESYVYTLTQTRYALWKYEDLFKRGALTKDEYQAMVDESKKGYEVEYFGKRRNWEELWWNNYQFEKNYFKGKKISGDCGTHAQALVIVYKMAGISAFTAQRVNEEATFAYPATHNFPLYFNPFLNRWSFVQVSDKLDSRYRKEFKITTWLDMPVVSESGYDSSRHYFKDQTSAEVHCNFLELGVPGALVQSFFDQGSQGKGLISQAQIPLGTIMDSDHDGLFDGIETSLDTDLKNPDSDGDGLSDFWEVDHGGNPLKKDTVKTIAIDGILSDWERSLLKMKEDPPGDGPEPGADILRSGMVYDPAGWLYIVIETAGDIQRNVIFQPLLTLNDEKDWRVKALCYPTSRYLEDRVGDKRTEIFSSDYDTRAGRRIWEMKVPLKGFLKGQSLDRLRAWIGLFKGSKYDSGDLEWNKP